MSKIDDYPKEGDILIALRDNGSYGEYYEQDITKGQEYKCLGTYNFGECVYIDSDSCGNLGMAFEDNFKIKKKAKYIKEKRKFLIEVTADINMLEENFKEKYFEKFKKELTIKIEYSNFHGINIVKVKEII